MTKTTEKTNERSRELTIDELDVVAGGVQRSTLPRNPFPGPLLPGPTFPR